MHCSPCAVSHVIRHVLEGSLPRGGQLFISQFFMLSPARRVVGHFVCGVASEPARNILSERIFISFAFSPSSTRRLPSVHAGLQISSRAARLAFSRSKPHSPPQTSSRARHDCADLAGREAARDGGSIAAPPPRIGAAQAATRSQRPWQITAEAAGQRQPRSAPSACLPRSFNQRSRYRACPQLEDSQADYRVIHRRSANSELTDAPLRPSGRSMGQDQGYFARDVKGMWG